MAEGVRVDVRQAAALTEFAHPSCHTIRMHGASVVLCEYEALIVVVFSEPQPLIALPRFVLLQKLHRFCRKRDKALGGSFSFSPLCCIVTVNARQLLQLSEL